MREKKLSKNSALLSGCLEIYLLTRYTNHNEMRMLSWSFFWSSNGAQTKIALYSIGNVLSMNKSCRKKLAGLRRKSRLFAYDTNGGGTIPSTISLIVYSKYVKLLSRNVG